MRIEEVYLTKENLLKIKSIDDLFYSDQLEIDWYLKRYSDKHKGILLLDNDKCVGYIVMAPVRKELYKAIISGVILNDVDVNPDMFIDSSKYNYIVSCVILEEYRHKGYGKMLVEKLLTSNNKSTHYCALTISKDGSNLASKFMKLKMKLNEEVNIYEIKKLF